MSQNNLDNSDAEDLGACPLCGRSMFSGPSVDRHHWVPKSQGGDEWSWLHRVCHKKIHSVLSNAELATDYRDLALLRQHPEVEKFITWVRRQPAQWLGRHQRLKKKDSL